MMNSLIEFFNAFNQWYWFSLAAILVILEMILGTSFFLLWLGVSAASVGIVLILQPSLTWEFQFLIFAAIAFACIAYWHFHLKHQKNTSDQPNLNRRNEQFVGRTITLKEPIVN